MTTTEKLEAANEQMRAVVRARLEATPATDHKVARSGWCDGGRIPTAQQVIERFNPTHPMSQQFFDLCDKLKEMHRAKSTDYGCPSGNDPLANIRNGAEFVGIPAWQGAMVRLSDKVTRLGTFNKTGRLGFEGVEDTLIDLASYSLLALLLYRESNE